MDSEAITIQSYDSHADAYAREANERGSWMADIDKVFELVGKENPFIVELGCGNGRDAKEFVKRTNRYLGVDASEKLLKNARALVPKAEFQQASFSSFQFPTKIDAVVAFASLLHVDKDVVQNILRESENHLNEKGIIFLTLQQGPYQKEVKKDTMGTRTFYKYSPELISELMPSTMSIVFEDRRIIRGKPWFAIALQKQ